MRTSLRFAALPLVIAASAGACATTIVDASTGGPGGAGGSATASSTHGTGGFTTDATTGPTGTGGWTTVSSTNGTGGWTTDATTATSGIGGWMTTTDATVGSSTGTGGFGFGACVDGTDLGIIDSKNLFPTVLVPCGMQYVGQNPQSTNCVVAATGLSQACGTCYGNFLQCAVASCINPCISNQEMPACVSCLAMSCDPTFFGCSGLSQPPDHP